MRGGVRGGVKERERRRPGGAAAPVIAAVGVVIYALALRRFGLDLADEGTLVADFASVARGAVPYRDFQTGYGPLGYYWNAAALAFGGGDLVAVRTGLAWLHGASALLLGLIGRRVGGTWVGVASVVVVWGMLRPVSPGAFATFNIPYPGWLAEALGYAAVALLLNGRLAAWRLGAVGSLWACAFLAKQNAGLFGLAGTFVVLALRRSDDGNAPGRFGWLLAPAMGAGTVALLVPGGAGPMEVLALGVPVWLLAVAVVRARPGPDEMRAAVIVGSAFVAVVVTACGLLGRHVGVETLVREMLQIGTGAAERFRTPYPGPIDLVRGALGGSDGVLGVTRRLVDDSWLVVLPVLAWIGAGRIAWRQRGLAPERRAVAVVGVLLLLQLYPRADAWHALPAAGLLIVFGLAAVAEVAHGSGKALLSVVMAGAIARSVPTIPVVAAMLRVPGEHARSVPHVSIRWDEVQPAHLARIPDVVASLRDVRSLFGFPALAFFNFVTDASIPVRHHYFFPGHPDAASDRELLRQLERNPPDAVILLDAPVAFFPEAFVSHHEIASWLRSPAWERTTIGPYVIGRRSGRR